MNKKELIIEDNTPMLTQELNEARERESQALALAAQTQAKLDNMEIEKRKSDSEAEEQRKAQEAADERDIKSKALNRNYKFKDRHELKRAIPYMEARDREMVTGRFKNLEDQGAPAQFHLHLYESEGFDDWTLIDGETHTIPYGVAWHVNNECYTLEYLELKDEFGRPTKIKQGIMNSRDRKQYMHPTKKIYRFQFIVPGAPAEFYPSGLIEMNYKK